MNGHTLSHYRILEKLGEGGMGAVYKAEDTKLRRTVALKFLPPDNRDRFFREAQAAAALNHPNIYTIFEIDEEHGFLAMELIDGPTVKDKIAARPLPLDEALDIAQQACAGLAAAHEKGIVHRDIKPANLMLTSSGQVKIMDFGLAQLAGGTRLTKTETVLGTPAYMSPEQAQRLATDERTDIWSLGVVLYEMVTGCLPFEGEREAGVVHSIIHEPHEPITAQRAAVPLELDRIVAKALAKKPGQRYQHIDDLLVDLRALRRRGRRAALGAKPLGLGGIDSRAAGRRGPRMENNTEFPARRASAHSRPHDVPRHGVLSVAFPGRQSRCVRLDRSRRGQSGYLRAADRLRLSLAAHHRSR